MQEGGSVCGATIEKRLAKGFAKERLAKGLRKACDRLCEGLAKGFAKGFENKCFRKTRTIITWPARGHRVKSPGVFRNVTGPNHSNR